jgi:hypothetical protein
MGDEAELELLLSFDGANYEAAEGYVVEFTVKRTARTAERPHGVMRSFSGRCAARPMCGSTTPMLPSGPAGDS